MGRLNALLGLKKIKMGVDKPPHLCYNDYRKRGNHNEKAKES
jgi:hypothetical protein